MDVHRWSCNIDLPASPGLVIGTFDGVHRGHQKMLARLISVCSDHGLTPAAMSFDPHPGAVITGRPPALLSSLRDRAYWLDHYGLEHWIVLPFTAAFMRLPPQRFVRDYLVGTLGIRYLLVGDDFRFGHLGQGNYALLRDLAAIGGYRLERIQTVSDAHGKRISSSLIRTLLERHDLTAAEHRLGHPLTVTARVRRGEGRGRRMQARTANLHVAENWCLPDGVYVVKLRVCEAPETAYWGVANLGKAPTFDGTRRKLEVHLLRPDRPELYGFKVQVSLHRFLREERRFANSAALQRQIHEDIEKARAAIAGNDIRQ